MVGREAGCNPWLTASKVSTAEVLEHGDETGDANLVIVPELREATDLLVVHPRPASAQQILNIETAVLPKYLRVPPAEGWMGNDNLAILVTAENDAIAVERDLVVLGHAKAFSNPKRGHWRQGFSS
jgi:hypothetical protein